MCGDCNCAGNRVHNQGLSVTPFDAMPKAEKEAFWKDIRDKSKGPLVAFCKETLERIETQRDENGTDTRPMPLKWYADKGFNTEHIKNTFEPEMVHGTPCYRVPMDYKREMTRDDHKRKEVQIVEPAKRTTLKGASTNSGKGLPPATLPEKDWSGEQWTKWKEHAVTVSKEKYDELTSKIDANRKYALPEFMSETVEKLKSQWAALKDMFGTAGDEVDLKARSTVQQAKDDHQKLMKTLTSIFKTYDKLGGGAGKLWPPEQQASKGGRAEPPAPTAKAKAKAKKAPSKAKAQAKKAPSKPKKKALAKQKAEAKPKIQPKAKAIGNQNQQVKNEIRNNIKQRQ